MAFSGILDRVIFWSVFKAILAVIAVICAIDFLFSLLDEMPNISPQYTLFDIILSLVLDFPAQFIEFASVASLIGTLVVLGMMASNSELVVIRAAGWSPVRTLWPAFAASLLVSFIGLGLAEYGVPSTSQLTVNDGEVVSDPVWFRDGTTFARVRQVTSEGALADLTLFEVNDQYLMHVRQADSAVYDPDQQHWQLRNVHVLEFQPRQILTSYKATDEWNPEARQEELEFIGQSVETLSLTDLVSFIQYRQEQGLDTRRHSLTFWRTVLQPVANLIMVLLGSSLVFGSIRMVSMGYRLTVGLMFGLGFYYTQDLFGFLSLVYGFHPLVVLAIPLVLFFGVALHRFKKST